MTGFFSRLAQRTGVRIGEAASSAAAISGPDAQAAPATPSPLEVDEVRTTASDRARPVMPESPVVEATSKASDQEANAPELRVGVRRIEPPEEIEPRREVTTELVSQTGRPIEPEHEGDREIARSTDGLEQFEMRVVASNPEHRAVERRLETIDPGEANQSAERLTVEGMQEENTRRKQTATAMEEYVVRMIETDRSVGMETVTTDASSVGDDGGVDDRSRTLLREVMEWIGAPAESPVEATEREEMRPIRQLERVREVVSADEQQRYEEPRVVDRGMEPWGSERAGGASREEPEMNDFTLSIGSIRIVIEEPQSQAPPVQPARAETRAGQQVTDASSRLSRHYITVG